LPSRRREETPLAAPEALLFDVGSAAPPEYPHQFLALRRRRRVLRAVLYVFSILVFCPGVERLHLQDHAPLAAVDAQGCAHDQPDLLAILAIESEP
jgi:hypothetical protein